MRQDMFAILRLKVITSRGSLPHMFSHHPWKISYHLKPSLVEGHEASETHIKRSTFKTSFERLVNQV